MRKLYTFLMAAVVAVSASAITRQKAVVPSIPHRAPVEEVSSVGLRYNVQTAAKSAAFSSVADVAGEYAWSYWGMLNNDSGNREGIVTITVLNEETGEVKIDGIFSAGTGITGTIKGIVDLEAGTLTIANKQNLGPDKSGDNNWFYLKDVVNDEMADGASAAANVVATLEGTTFTFPEECIFAVGDFDNEELGWWKLTMANIFIAEEAGEENSDWTEFSTATMLDGWIVPGLSYNDGSYAESADFPLSVKVQRNSDDPNLIRIVNPYVQASGFPIAGSEGYIILDVTDPEFVLVTPEIFSGFSNGANKINCFNVEGYWVANGNSKEEIQDALGEEIAEWSSMKTDGDKTVISIPTCRFNWPGVLDKLYTWNNRADAMKATITIDKALSGIDNVIISNDENAPVEYFNIQGVRVDNPQAGSIVIRRQGSKVSKMIVR